MDHPAWGHRSLILSSHLVSLTKVYRTRSPLPAPRTPCICRGGGKEQEREITHAETCPTSNSNLAPATQGLKLPLNLPKKKRPSQDPR